MNDTHIQEDPLMPFKRVNQAFAAREQDLHRQLDSLSNLLNQERGNVQAVTTHVQQLAQREQALQEELAALRRTLAQAEAATDDRERSLTEAAQREQALQEELAALRRTLAQAEAATDDRERSLTEAAQHKLGAARAETQGYLQQFVERERAFAEQLAQVQRESQQAAAEQNRAQAERERELNAALLTQSEARNVRQLQLVELGHQIEAARKLEATLRADLARQAEQAAIISAEIAQMQQTVAWRLTARLGRWLGDPDCHPAGAPFSAHTIAANSPTADQPANSAPNVQINEAAAGEQDSPPAEAASVASTFPKITYDELAMTEIRHVDQLLELHDVTFVDTAYRALLGRVPDQEGAAYYLRRLRSGISRIQILSQLRSSREAEAYKAEVLGLDNAVRAYKLGCLPLIGWFYRAIKGLEGNQFTHRKLRIVENQIYLLGEHNSDRFSIIEKSLTAITGLVVRQGQLFNATKIGTQNSDSGAKSEPGGTCKIQEENMSFYRHIPHEKDIYLRLKQAIHMKTINRKV